MKLRHAELRRPRSHTRMRRALLATALGAATSLIPPGCSNDAWDMAKQKKYDTLTPAPFFPDGSSARPLVEGTVDRRGAVSSESPDPTLAPRPLLSAELLARGQVLFDVNCAPCHARDGYGDGMIVERGYPRPPSLHEGRLRSSPDEYLYQIITFGLGKMPVYGVDIPPADRWPIVAYIRALQLGQYARLVDAPPEAQRLLVDAPNTTRPFVVPAGPPEFAPTPGRSRAANGPPSSKVGNWRAGAGSGPHPREAPHEHAAARRAAPVEPPGTDARCRRAGHRGPCRLAAAGAVLLWLSDELSVLERRTTRRGAAPGDAPPDGRPLGLEHSRPARNNHRHDAAAAAAFHPGRAGHRLAVRLGKPSALAARPWTGIPDLVFAAAVLPRARRAVPRPLGGRLLAAGALVAAADRCRRVAPAHRPRRRRSGRLLPDLRLCGDGLDRLARAALVQQHHGAVHRHRAGPDRHGCRHSAAYRRRALAENVPTCFRRTG